MDKVCKFPGCKRFPTEDNGFCIGHKMYGNVVSKSNYKPIARRSEKMKDAMPDYKKKVALFLLTHPKCQVRGCNKKSTQVHHKAGRIGEKLTDVKDFFATCDDHHTHIELNPKEAKKKGYSKSRLIKE